MNLMAQPVVVSLVCSTLVFIHFELQLTKQDWYYRDGLFVLKYGRTTGIFLAWFKIYNWVGWLLNGKLEAKLGFLDSLP